MPNLQGHRPLCSDVPTIPRLDIDTPGDIVGDAWLRSNPQHMTPVMPSSRRFALGHDVPPTVGRTSIRIHTTTTTGCPLELYLPEVTILRHDTVPFLVGLPSHERMRIVIDTPAKAITVGTAKAPVQCAIRRSHLVLPVGTRTSPARRPTSSYYIRTEMALVEYVLPSKRIWDRPAPGRQRGSYYRKGKEDRPLAPGRSMGIKPAKRQRRAPTSPIPGETITPVERPSEGRTADRYEHSNQYKRSLQGKDR